MHDLSLLPNGIRSDLREAGCTGSVSNIHVGEWSKVLATVATATGERRWLKLATYDHGRALLRQEALGYRELGPLLKRHFRVAEFVLLRDGDGCTAALIDDLPGRRARAWRFPRESVSVLAGTHRNMAFGAWAHALLEGLPESAQRNRLLAAVARLGEPNAGLALGPSHGDFSPWNVLYDGSKQPGILDFEHYAAERPIGYDDCHWLVGTLARRAVRHGLTNALVAHASRLPAVLWRLALRSRYTNATTAGTERLELTPHVAIGGYLLAWSAACLQEHAALDDARRIDANPQRPAISPANYRLRNELLSLYVRLFESVGSVPAGLPQ